ncbi:hypothetical protein B0H19DRAFT_1159349 [Mycena capillaripes]|nr:hypothetical protein B0H19DRAFT_1159349 [Mycena capillaripes]
MLAPLSAFALAPSAHPLPLPYSTRSSNPPTLLLPYPSPLRPARLAPTFISTLHKWTSKPASVLYLTSPHHPTHGPTITIYRLPRSVIARFFFL